MIIETILVGELKSNCYLVAGEEGTEGIVIDPGGDVDEIIAAVEKQNIKITKVFDTHGHWDHAGANMAIAKATGCEVFVHKEDIDTLADPMKNLSIVVASEEISLKADTTLNDGQKIKVGTMEIKVIHTPGHTPGSISLLIGENLFCGDLIFYESIGRTDLPGSNETMLHESICLKVMTLPDSVSIYPGHGDKTSVGWERLHNPYRIYW